MKIFIGADHAGIDLMNDLFSMLEEKNINVTNINKDFTNNTEYPQIALKLCENILTDKEDTFGILVCGTGVGMAIAANKQKGIRAVCCSDVYTAKMSREHNNCNVLCLGARVLGTELAKLIVEQWILSSFDGGRHQKRLNLIE